MCSTNTVILIEKSIKTYKCYSNYNTIEENIRNILMMSGGIDRPWSPNKKIKFIIDNDIELGEIKIFEEI